MLWKVARDQREAEEELDEEQMEEEEEGLPPPSLQRKRCRNRHRCRTLKRRSSRSGRKMFFEVQLEAEKATGTRERMRKRYR